MPFPPLLFVAVMVQVVLWETHKRFFFSLPALPVGVDNPLVKADSHLKYRLLLFPKSLVYGLSSHPRRSHLRKLPPLSPDGKVPPSGVLLPSSGGSPLYWIARHPPPLPLASSGWLHKKAAEPHFSFAKSSLFPLRRRSYPVPPPPPTPPPPPPPKTTLSLLLSHSQEENTNAPQ